MDTRVVCVALALFAPACGSSGSSAEPVNLEFRAENDLLEGFEQDSGFLPAQSPAAIRVVAGATASLVATAQATATGDDLTPVAGSGSLAMEAGLSLEVSAKIDTAGVEYEGVIETFEYGIEPAMASFEPFAIGETVTLESALPPGELARVPVPSVPGATLVVDIAGGQINAAYSGVCAVATGGVAQYTGQAVIDGTVQLEGTIELELLVVSETFGPFSIEVPIPPATTALDLGTLSTSDGTPAEGSPCDGMSGDTETADPTTASGGSTGGDPTGEVPSTGSTTDADPTTGGDSTGDSGGAESSSGAEVECTVDSECDDGDACVENQCVPVPAACVDGTDCDACPSTETCGLCVQYEGNACSELLDTCLFDVDCYDLVECVNGCADEACNSACAKASTDEAVDLYNAVVECLFDACS